ERYPGRDPAEAAAPGRHTRIRPAPRECSVAQGALPGGAPWGARQLARTVRDESVDELVRELVVADRQKRAELSLLRLSLALATLAAGEVDLQPAPTERPPEHRLDHPHRLHAPWPDHLRRQRDEAAVEVQPVGALGHREPVELVEAPPHER